MSNQLTNLIAEALINLDYMQENLSTHSVVSHYMDYLQEWEDSLLDLQTLLLRGEKLDLTMTDGAIVALGNLAALQSALEFVDPMAAARLPKDITLENALSAVYGEILPPYLDALDAAATNHFGDAYAGEFAALSSALQATDSSEFSETPLFDTWLDAGEWIDSHISASAMEDTTRDANDALEEELTKDVVLDILSVAALIENENEIRSYNRSNQASIPSPEDVVAGLDFRPLPVYTAGLESQRELAV